MSGALAVFLVTGLLAIGHYYTWWGPEPPSDPNALVLRVRFVKGMTSAVDRPVPDISIYGDGRMVIKTIYLTTTPAREVVMDQRLTRMAYRRVYRDARLAGLGSSRTFTSHKQIIDGGRTDITLLARGKPRRSSLPSGADGVRVWLINRLLKKLRSLHAGDLARRPVPYQPARLALVSHAAPEHDTSMPITQWPLAPLPATAPGTATGAATGTATAACTALAGADAAKAARLARTSPATYWRSGDTVYSIAFRPLLPDEGDCTAVTP
jgi:hypothetical protein